jgi:hypothetical protein
MSKKKKKPAQKASVHQQNMSPKQYIMTGRARKLPLRECYINSDWKNAGLSSLVVARQHTTGNVTFGFYLVDTFCLGIKNADVGFNRNSFEYADFLSNISDRYMGEIEKIDYALAHNILFGSVAYAESLGLKPHKDWAFAQMILEEDTEDVELIELEFGKDGKPLFINGPYDSVNKVVNTLKKSVGEGNFDVLLNVGEDGFDNMYYDDDDEDYEDDDEDEGDDSIEDVEYEEEK